jgi:hypothetical protein
LLMTSDKAQLQKASTVGGEAASWRMMGSEPDNLGMAPKYIPDS